MKIEDIWASLRDQGVSVQRRIDAQHPLDIYADFDLPNHPGLMVICPARPPDFQSLEAITIERHERTDGRWTLRVLLTEPKLLLVFAELCRDIIDATRRLEPAQCAGAILSRIEHWRRLMAKPAALDTALVRGLIGELLVLEHVMAAMSVDDAISAWTGPLGTSQDFQLPSGTRLEAKAVDHNSPTVTINGLDQLDSGLFPLRLCVVRIINAGRDEIDAVTVPLLVQRIRQRLEHAPSALALFDQMLTFAGWTEEDGDAGVVVKLVRIDEHEVAEGFPRLTAATVPTGIVDTRYTIVLPNVVAGHD